MIACLFCRRAPKPGEEFHTAERDDGGTDYACEECLARLAPPPPPKPQGCPECGASFGGGCDCADNRLAIGRGERAKARREEP